MRETRKSCSRRWAGNATTCQRWFRDSNRIGRFRRARRFGRAETGARRARARPERTGVPFARARGRRKGGRVSDAPASEEEGVPLFARANCDHRRVCPRKQKADFFFYFRFFQTASSGGDRRFFGMSVLHRHERSIRFWQQLSWSASWFFSPPPRPRSDRRSLLSFLFLAHLLVECRDRATSFGAASGAAGVSSGASRVSSRRARRGRRDGSRARRERG